MKAIYKEKDGWVELIIIDSKGESHWRGLFASKQEAYENECGLINTIAMVGEDAVNW